MAEIVAQEDIPPLFRPSCSDCAFCDGLKDMDCQEKGSLGVLPLEGEEKRDGVEDAGNAHRVVKSRQTSTDRRRKAANEFASGRTMAKPFILRPISCSLDSPCNDYWSPHWGLRGSSICGGDQKLAKRVPNRNLTEISFHRKKKSNTRSKAHLGGESRSVRLSLSLPLVLRLIDPLVAILIGLLLMMWPILTKVQYERLPAVFSTPNIWQQLALSIILNWVIAPFVMLGLAWATLPEKKLASERQGVVLVGIARCIGEFIVLWDVHALNCPII